MVAEPLGKTLAFNVALVPVRSVAASVVTPGRLVEELTELIEVTGVSPLPVTARMRL